MQVEAQILEAMRHPRCVGWGEIGLDYHYMNSPADIQREVFRRQLKHAVRLGKPLTIHTREADDDVEHILKEEVPQEHKVSMRPMSVVFRLFLVDPHSLFYRHTDACPTIARSFPEPLYWHHWLSSPLAPFAATLKPSQG